jgi:uncharacterized damage-inducible protein DinB
MTGQSSPLAMFYKPGWENYQQAFVQTIASLSSEQLGLSVAPHYMSIRELLVHMLDARVSWFSAWMGEENAAMVRWGQGWEKDGPVVHEAAELAAMFEQSWHVIASALDRWTSADLEQLVSPPASYQEWLRNQGILEEEPPRTRQWIIWHVMEHEIYHGGELSLALGTYGVDSFYTW